MVMMMILDRGEHGRTWGSPGVVFTMIFGVTVLGPRRERCVVWCSPNAKH